MKNEKILPFANETKKLKNDFKNIIDEMDDETFLDMMFFLISSGFQEDFDEEFDEELENDLEDYESPFSGEMVNFKCHDCNKISAYPIEIVNNIYELTKKEPQVECFHCENENTSPIHYKAPDGKVFENQSS